MVPSSVSFENVVDNNWQGQGNDVIVLFSASIMSLLTLLALFARTEWPQDASLTSEPFSNAFIVDVIHHLIFDLRSFQ